MLKFYLELYLEQDLITLFQDCPTVTGMCLQISVFSPSVTKGQILLQ